MELSLAGTLPVLDQIVVAALLRRVPLRLEHVVRLQPLHSRDPNICEAEKRLIQIAKAVIRVVVRITNFTVVVAKVRLSKMVLGAA